MLYTASQCSVFLAPSASTTLLPNGYPASQVNLNINSDYQPLLSEQNLVCHLHNN